LYCTPTVPIPPMLASRAPRSNRAWRPRLSG